MAKILIVEDEAKILRSLDQGLRSAGYDVVPATNGSEAVRLGSSEKFDAVVLDWMLPELDGLQVLHALRSRGHSVPVLLLTSRDAIEDRVAGLDAGADDYLLKPFAFAELLARLRVMLRREQPERDTVLYAGNLRIDLLARRVTCDGHEIPLAHREYALLEYLARHKGQPVTREMLGQDVWNEPNLALTNVVEVYVNQLRKKLDQAGCSTAIKTLRGIGYRLEE